VHVCNPSTREAEAGRLGIQGQPGLQREFQVSLDLGLKLIHSLILKDYDSAKIIKLGLDKVQS
jgi:hypothetical protein